VKVLAISGFDISKRSLNSSVSVPVCWNNDMYPETDMSLLLIKAAACTIARGRYVSFSSSSLAAVLSLSNPCFVNRRASSCLALALLISFSYKTLLGVKSLATFLLQVVKRIVPLLLCGRHTLT
jgi:hypothetical protein